MGNRVAYKRVQIRCHKAVVFVFISDNLRKGVVCKVERSKRWVSFSCLMHKYRFFEQQAASVDQNACAGFTSVHTPSADRKQCCATVCVQVSKCWQNGTKNVPIWEKQWHGWFGDIYVWMLVPSRQQGDSGGVGTGLTVSVMCSDTQMAADTTQIDSHSCPLAPTLTPPPPLQNGCSLSCSPSLYVLLSIAWLDRHSK